MEKSCVIDEKNEKSACQRGGGRQALIIQAYWTGVVAYKELNPKS